MIACISLEGMSFHAFHGVHPQEKLVGSQFVIDIEVSLNVPENGFQDKLDSTIDYEEVYALIALVMKEPKCLIETVAEEIISKVFIKEPLAVKVSVSVAKMYPPVGGFCHKSKVILTKDRLY